MYNSHCPFHSIEKILENLNSNVDRWGNWRYIKVFQTKIQRTLFGGLLNNCSFENLRKIPWRHELWNLVLKVVGCIVAVLQESLIFIKVAIERPSVKIVILKIFYEGKLFKIETIHFEKQYLWKIHVKQFILNIASFYQPASLLLKMHLFLLFIFKAFA